jgi:membrane fusion protein, multidrug efflux system
LRNHTIAASPRRWILLLSPLLSALVACGDPPATATAGPGRQVVTVPVAGADLPVEFEYAARTASSQRVEIRPRVTGYLEEIAYREGGFVQEGEVLFRMDPKPFEARLRGARGELSQQQARLDNARALLGRVIPLAEARAVAQKELDDARARVAESAAAVEAASARVYEAELELDYATIRAPVTGIAGAARFRQGALVTGSLEPLTEVARVDPIWVEFSVAENQLLAARHNAEDQRVRYPEHGAFDVSLTLADGTGHPWTGRLSFADAAVSDRTGSLLMRAEIPNPEASLRPGQFVSISLGGAYRPDAIAVPQAAVQQGPKGPYVWIVDSESRAQRRPVITGPWVGASWLIRQGLTAGESVIVEGLVGLAAGTPVVSLPAAMATADMTDAN